MSLLHRSSRRTSGGRRAHAPAVRHRDASSGGDERRGGGTVPVSTGQSSATLMTTLE
jgi:hypothetical protein